MTESMLQPEVRLDLRIQLDRLSRAGERCRQALDELTSGKLTREAYLDVLRQQKDAQLQWELIQRKYLLDGP
jgi:hypothetical protein